MQSFALTSPSLPAAAASPGRRSLAATPVRAAAASDEPKLNKYSARITEPKSQGASQAVLYGVGLTDADLRKPQVGISSVWYEGNTCNMHLLSLAEAVRDGVRSAGMVAFRFNTVGVSDAISMGTRGMCYSLQSRDLIADSIETVMGAQHYDANISIPGCDKNVSQQLLTIVAAAAMQFLALTSPSLPAAAATTGRRRLPATSVRAAAVTDEPKLNKYSARMTEPKSQGASQAVLYGVGLTDAELRKPQVGISSVWHEGNICNMHLLSLAEAVRDGVRCAGMVAFRFNTVGVSDGISMGTRGMCYSLQSRDLIPDSIETVMGAQHYDANISIPGCDKNMPGTIMAMGRLNRPTIMVYGGTINCYGEYVSGSISDEERKNVLRNSCPGAGACGGMYTANTIASAIETMGMSLPYSSSNPAEDPLKLEECRLAGKYDANASQPRPNTVLAAYLADASPGRSSIADSGDPDLEVGVEADADAVEQIEQR